MMGPCVSGSSTLDLGVLKICTFGASAWSISRPYDHCVWLVVEVFYMSVDGISVNFAVISKT